MKNFKGTYTALITPFRIDGSIDFEILTNLIEMQIAGGVDGLVPVGTTGESPTLRTEEHIKVIEHVVRVSDGRCQIIAGTGANSTAEAVELTLAAKSFGVDGTLQVTPYYNKPNNHGLISHFSKVADIGLPVVLYNVPGRTSCEISIPIVAELSKHPNIVSIKEASGSIDRVQLIKEVCELSILSGDDILAVPMIESGACGVISVASNIIPSEICSMISAALDQNIELSYRIHDKYSSLFEHLFIDTNPIPVKAASALLGYIKEIYRLPLCSMTKEKRDILCETLNKTGVLS